MPSSTHQPLRSQPIHHGGRRRRAGLWVVPCLAIALTISGCGLSGGSAATAAKHASDRFAGLEPTAGWTEVATLGNTRTDDDHVDVTTSAPYGTVVSCTGKGTLKLTVKLEGDLEGGGSGSHEDKREYGCPTSGEFNDLSAPTTSSFGAAPMVYVGELTGSASGTADKGIEWRALVVGK